MEYTVRDVTVYYEIHGSGKPVVMIHGWSPDHRLMKGCMEPIFQSMEMPWQRIYFDLFDALVKEWLDRVLVEAG